MSNRRLNAVWEHSISTGSARLVLLTLADRADDDGLCWPGMGYLSHRAKIRRSNIPRVIDDLQDLGELLVFMRDRRRSNLYIVTVQLSPWRFVAAVDRAADMGAGWTRGSEGLLVPVPVLDQVFSPREHLEPVSLEGVLTVRTGVIMVRSGVLTVRTDPLVSLTTPKGEIWEKTLGELELQMTKATFDTWLRGSRVIAEDEHSMVVDLKHDYAVEWIDKRLRGVIQRTLDRQQKGLSVTFVANGREAT